jgi:hypothetical protein
MTPYSSENGYERSGGQILCTHFLLLSDACYILRLSNPSSYGHSNEWWKIHPRDLSYSEVTAWHFATLCGLCFIQRAYISITFKQVIVITRGEPCCRWQEHESPFTLVCLVFLFFVGSLTRKTPVDIPCATVLIAASKTARTLSTAGYSTPRQNINIFPSCAMALGLGKRNAPRKVGQWILHFVPFTLSLALSGSEAKTCHRT